MGCFFSLPFHGDLDQFELDFNGAGLLEPLFLAVLVANFSVLFCTISNIVARLPGSEARNSDGRQMTTDALICMPLQGCPKLSPLVFDNQL